ncbi:bifunctional 4-hydroxy-2-oxoglutarate aldolase/2-dehydro-3-deoxy-phosphogluconate aldolase [Leifsonia sp. Leaf336]|uniref:bifunctional 4-hydroxy-2-oxoglutarate aldolase/2-dehydro-3-deoxy-phosphogluconate aldolase n=1 Tax=Leifsonia sp. Leaf336 TaxID=1736341 RepID=UPI001F1C99BE|nr:bifunctional 4-hydroxy-2-oxoglutarate aldolase/2-dehydro-3-deoxy-phosphogluconate aldolase [Leifsonia sp. Leaf336]
MTSEAAGFAGILRQRPLVAILRGMDISEAMTIAERVWDRGIGIVEVPVQDSASFTTFQAVLDQGAERGEAVGAGTIVDIELLRRVVDAGASFTVAPGLDLDVLVGSNSAGVPHLPGVATATELQTALRAGCTVVKAFPASSLSSRWMREMRGPFPQVSCVATGGIDASNAAEFLAAGAIALGVGSALQSASSASELFDIAEEALAVRREH